MSSIGIMAPSIMPDERTISHGNRWAQQDPVSQARRV